MDVLSYLNMTKAKQHFMSLSMGKKKLPFTARNLWDRFPVPGPFSVEFECSACVACVVCGFSPGSLTSSLRTKTCV